MNKEDIIRMAREAGLHLYVNELTEEPYAQIVERFAALVAAAEREACAQIAEETVCDTHLPTGVKIYGTRAAKAIRERSNP